jgi:hypothetical protein
MIVVAAIDAVPAIAHSAGFAVVPALVIGTLPVTAVGTVVRLLLYCAAFPRSRHPLASRSFPRSRLLSTTRSRLSAACDCHWNRGGRAGNAAAAVARRTSPRKGVSGPVLLLMPACLCVAGVVVAAGVGVIVVVAAGGVVVAAGAVVAAGVVVTTTTRIARPQCWQTYSGTLTSRRDSMGLDRFPRI